MLLSSWICLCFLCDMVHLRHLFALFVWLVLRGFQERKRENTVCMCDKMVRIWQVAIFFEDGWPAKFLLSHYLVLPKLSLGVVILISTLTGAQSRHDLIYSNVKYKFVMVKTSETQLKCVTDENAQATKNGKSGGEKMKNKNPRNLWQKLPRRTKQIQKLEPV